MQKLRVLFGEKPQPYYQVWRLGFVTSYFNSVDKNMKYKRKQGNSYLFECDGEELGLEKIEYEWFVFKNLLIDKFFRVATSTSEYKDIQTAVSMMQILIEEGEV